MIQFSNLDFDQIRTSIRNYLKTNSNFTDFDYEGSNLSIIIDILAYNTYLQSYNQNMIVNEVFLESATLRDNVISRAQTIGYVPRSRRSANTRIQFEVPNVSAASITLRKGLVCSSKSFENQNYTFITPEDISVTVQNSTAFFDVPIYEGFYLTENFKYDPDQQFQRFILSNSLIDTSLIQVKVNDLTYTLADTILNLNSNSTVYFIREIEDQRYEILFGDGIFGRKLTSDDSIEISYVISSGESANGITNFNFQGQLVVTGTDTFINSGVANLFSIDATQNGSEVESVNSIKKYAPRFYAAQNRAVTPADYETLIPQIYTQTESIVAFGGEDLNPPQYGKVFVTLKPRYGNFISNSVKDRIRSELRKYKVSGIGLEFLDLKYLYVEVQSNVYVTSYQTEIIQKILQSFQTYAASTELNRYNSRFKYSKFLKLIDDSSNLITSNDTRIEIRRDLQPILNSITQYEICFGNEFAILNLSGYNIRSSGFKIQNFSETLYLSDSPNTSTVFLFYLRSSEPVIYKQSAGTIDYSKGEIRLNGINIVSTSKFKNSTSIIEISTAPKYNDVVGEKDLYLQFDVSQSQVQISTQLHLDHIYGKTRS